jgi:multidrug efflux pump subunit AcrB
MRKIVSEFVKFPFYANLIIVFLLIGGIVSYKSMKKSFFPEVSSRMIYVSVFYPGASPVEMEEGVTSRIEEAVRGLVGIKQITSTSSENSCSVQIETTGTHDIDETLMDVKNAVDGISSFSTTAATLLSLCDRDNIFCITTASDNKTMIPIEVTMILRLNIKDVVLLSLRYISFGIPQIPKDNLCAYHKFTYIYVI